MLCQIRLSQRESLFLFRLERDVAFFHGKLLAPFLGGIEVGGAFRLGVVAGKISLPVSRMVPPLSRVKMTTPLAVDAALDDAKV